MFTYAWLQQPTAKGAIGTHKKKNPGGRFVLGSKAPVQRKMRVDPQPKGITKPSSSPCWNTARGFKVQDSRQALSPTRGWSWSSPTRLLWKWGHLQTPASVMLQEWPAQSGKPASPRPQAGERRMTTGAAVKRPSVREPRGRDKKIWRRCKCKRATLIGSVWRKFLWILRLFGSRIATLQRRSLLPVGSSGRGGYSSLIFKLGSLSSSGSASSMSSVASDSSATSLLPSREAATARASSSSSSSTVGLPKKKKKLWT